MYKPKRDSNASPYIINNQVWVDQGKSYGFEVVKTVDYKNLLDLPPSIQACVIGEHLIALTVNGELGGSCNIDHRLRSMKITELVSNTDLTNHLLVIDDINNVYHCRLIDDELQLTRQVAKNVDSVIIHSTSNNIDIIGRIDSGTYYRDPNGKDEDITHIHILTLLHDNRLMLVTFGAGNYSSILRREINIPGGVKFIKFINNNQIMAVNGDIYNYEHVLSSN